MDPAPRTPRSVALVALATVVFAWGLPPGITAAQPQGQLTYAMHDIRLKGQ